MFAPTPGVILLCLWSFFCFFFFGVFFVCFFRFHVLFVKVSFFGSSSFFVFSKRHPFRFLVTKGFAWREAAFWSSSDYSILAFWRGLASFHFVPNWVKSVIVGCYRGSFFSFVCCG